jgi:hypothetical protein
MSDDLTNTGEVYAEIRLDEFSVDGDSETPPAVEGAEEVVESEEEVVVEGSEPERDEQGRFKKKKTAQDRINEITAKYRDTERQLATERAVNQTLMQQMGNVTQTPDVQYEQPTATFGEPEPKLEDYNYDAVLHAQAVGAWQVRKELADTEAKAKQQNEVASQVRRDAEWNVKTAEFKQKFPDFDARVQDPNLSITPAMATVIKSSNKGPEMAYYLAQNPDTAADIASSTPEIQAYRLGQIEARMVTKPRNPAAPPPVTPVAGSSEGGAKSWHNDPNISPEKWAELRNKEIAEKRAARK